MDGELVADLDIKAHRFPKFDPAVAGKGTDLCLETGAGTRGPPQLAIVEPAIVLDERSGIENTIVRGGSQRSVIERRYGRIDGEGRAIHTAFR